MSGLVERHRELAEVARLLGRAAAGSGGVLVVIGPAGSGRTVLADAAAELARNRAFEVVRGTSVTGRTGRSVWAQFVRDIDGLDELADRLVGEHDVPDRDLDSAAVALCAGTRRLMVIDDLDRGGPDAIAMLAVVAPRRNAHKIPRWRSQATVAVHRLRLVRNITSGLSRRGAPGFLSHGHGHDRYGRIDSAVAGTADLCGVRTIHRLRGSAFRRPERNGLPRPAISAAQSSRCPFPRRDG